MGESVVDSRLLGEWLGDLARRHRIPVLQGALCEAGEITVARAGFNDSATSEEPEGSVSMPFASVTKLFTATVAMQLVTDGDLDLGEPVNAYLPEWPEPAAGVTLRHLLSHSSGLVCDPPGEPASAGQAAMAAASAGLLFAPGTAFSYSNAGFTVVGRLIEAATGMGWREAVTDFVLRPLDIAPAFLTGHQAPGRAVGLPGHAATAAGPVRIEVAVPRAAEPAAVLVGRVEDLAAFGRLFLDRRATAHAALLEDEAVQAMRQAPFDTVPFGLADGWGLGWALYGQGPDRWLGLDGAGAGTTCQLRVHPGSGTVLALQANSSAGAAAWDDLVALLRAEGREIGMPSSGAADDGARALPDCAGRWINGETVYRISPAASGSAVLEDDDGTEYHLTGRGVRYFAARHTDNPAIEHLGRFLLDPVTGRADLMQFGGRVMQRAA
ncbi:serine hydrolase domain-containing protein [Streptomyces sp. NPDC048637]|uniref:serine hydrolase domain-containing protein n=1 Tax=Streptomyces sp. NPDC048637 TaxID=3155636 RepID=UPI003430EB70